MQDKGISNHILPASATMVGVCMTVVSVIQLIPPHANVTHSADRLLAVDSLVFLISAVLSYWSLRHQDHGVVAERYADRLFLFGLAVMALVSCVIAFELL
ncbi:MAG TPA: hypothetical protein VL550_06650 [Rhodocyclaceae bacterium]|jgi:hypothetical protein|nr:hypothetical protein [Rhodocyclaceae bacterium]